MSLVSDQTIVKAHSSLRPCVVESVTSLRELIALSVKTMVREKENYGCSFSVYLFTFAVRRCSLLRV